MPSPTCHTFEQRIWRILPDEAQKSLTLELRDETDRVQFAQIDLYEGFALQQITPIAFDAWYSIQANLGETLLVGQWKDPSFPAVSDYFTLDWSEPELKPMAAAKAQQLLYKQQLNIRLPHARNTARSEPTAAYLFAQQHFAEPLAPHYDELTYNGYTIVSVYKVLAADPSGATPGLLSQHLLVLCNTELLLEAQLQAQTQAYALDPFSVVGDVLVYIGAQTELCLCRLALGE